MALTAAQERFSSYRVVLALSNLPSSGALISAKEAGVESLAIPSHGVVREDHERAVLAAIASRSIDLICLAGYMRLLSAHFIEEVSRPILNVHPSLLPSFPGMHAQRQAIDAGVRWSGATVHFVDGGLDTGPIILQEPVGLEPGDTEDSLSVRILETEHRIYPRAVDLVAREAYEIAGRRVLLRHSTRG